MNALVFHKIISIYIIVFSNSYNDHIILNQFFKIVKFILFTI